MFQMYSGIPAALQEAADDKDVSLAVLTGESDFV